MISSRLSGRMAPCCCEWWFTRASRPDSAMSKVSTRGGSSAPPAPWQLAVARRVIFVEAGVCGLLAAYLLWGAVIALSPGSLFSVAEGGTGPQLLFLWGGGLAGAMSVLLLAGAALFRWRLAYGAAVGVQPALLLAVWWVRGVNPDMTAACVAFVALIVPVVVLALLVTPGARHADRTDRSRPEPLSRARVRRS